MSLTLLPASASRAGAVPLFATPRNPHRDTLGRDVGLIAERMKRKPMPWQQELFDTAYELDPATGTLWYREIVISLMRQQGKTTCIIPVGTHRAIAWAERQNILFIAQTRKAARRKFLNEHVPVIQASPYGRLIGEDGLRTTNGDESVTFERGNESWWGIDAPTEQSGHGDTLGLAIADEFWWQTDSRVEQAIGPAMITVEDAQKWILSAAGNARSVPLRKKRDAGRDRVRLGVDSRTLYLEYGIPEGDDVYDPKVWAERMPALGYTIGPTAVQAEAESMDEKEFRRAYGNQWSDSFAGEWVIPEQDWTGCADPDSQIDDEDTIVWAVDVAPDMAWASIAIAGLRADGVPHIEIVEHRPGTAWLPERTRQLQADYGGEVFGSYNGPVGALWPRFQEAGIELGNINDAEMARACGALKEAVLDKRVRHLDDGELNVALSGAERARSGDAWKWTRSRSLADISTLYAVTVAHWKVLEALEDSTYDPLAGIL